MKDSIFADAQVAEVERRHAARKEKSSWSPDDMKSATEDLSNVLEELKRTNRMVETQEQWIRERDQTIAALLPAPTSPPSPR